MLSVLHGTLFESTVSVLVKSARLFLLLPGFCVYVDAFVIVDVPSHTWYRRNVYPNNKRCNLIPVSDTHSIFEGDIFDTSASACKIKWLFVSRKCLNYMSLSYIS